VPRAVMFQSPRREVLSGGIRVEDCTGMLTLPFHDGSKKRVTDGALLPLSPRGGLVPGRANEREVR